MCAGITISDKASCAQHRPTAVHEEAEAAAVPLRLLPEPESNLKFCREHAERVCGRV